MVFLMKKVSSLEKKVEDLTEFVKTQSYAMEAMTIDGVNLQHLKADDPYSYGLRLMDNMFEREEMYRSLLFKSDKSKKPPLNPEKVNLIFKLIDDRFKYDKDYKKNWDDRIFVRKENQKCRDSMRVAPTKKEKNEETEA